MSLIELRRTLEKADQLGMSNELSGEILYKVFKVHKSCWMVFKNRDKTSDESEYPLLKTDIINLSRPLSLQTKISICDRMATVYSVFKV